MEFIDKEEFTEAANLKRYNLEFLSGVLMKVFGYDRVNALYSGAYDDEPLPFMDNLFKRLKVKIDVKDNEFERLPKDGSYIVVSNHPFGFIDGLIMMDIML